MTQLPDLPSADSPPLSTLEGEPFYGADLPSLMACLEPLPHTGMLVSPNITPPPLFQVTDSCQHLYSAINMHFLYSDVTAVLPCNTCLALRMHYGHAQSSIPSYTAEHVEVAPSTANESLSRDDTMSQLHFNKPVRPTPWHCNT